jgi:hypothetical protein
MLDKEKKSIKDKLRSSYVSQFKKDSAQKQEELKNTIVKKKIEKQITVREKIFRRK